MSNQYTIWLLDGAFHVLPMGGMGVLPYLPVDGTVVATADFDGDGRTDVVWRSASGAYQIVRHDGLTALSSGPLSAPPHSTLATPIVLGTALLDDGSGTSGGRSSLIVSGASATAPGQLEAWVNVGVDANHLPVFDARPVPNGGRTDLTVCRP